MLNDHKCPEWVVKFAETVLADTQAIAPTLKKQGINYDHHEVKRLIEVAYLHRAIMALSHEMSMQNMETKAKKFPLSLFNRKV